MVLNIFDRSDEPVPAFGKGFDKAGVLGMIAQGLAQLVYRDPQAVIEVDGRFRAPQLLLQFLAGNYLPWMPQECRKHFEGLTLEPHPNTRAPQFPSFQVGLKNTELHPHGAIALFCCCHCTRSIHPAELTVNGASELELAG